MCWKNLIIIKIKYCWNFQLSKRNLSINKVIIVKCIIVKCIIYCEKVANEIIENSTNNFQLYLFKLKNL